MQRKYKCTKVISFFCSIVVILCCFIGCTQNGTPSKNSGNASNEILTQKATSANKIPITVLVKYAFSINNFEKVVEEKFPDIDIIQVGNYTRDMGISEYAARLEHGDLTDIVMTWPLDVGRDFWADNLIDLSGMDFTSKYNLSMLNTISSDDGALYYLPGPAQIRGIVYNKTLFKENNWQVPTDFEGFISLCKQIEESGMRSLQLGFENSEVLDTAIFGFNYGSSFSKIQDMQWLDDYNDGIGSLGEHFETALDTFQRMIDEGIFKQEDLKIGYAKRETMLFTRQCAMVEDSVLMARMGERLTGTTDEFALMPFFGPSTESDWTRLYMVCYIGLNKNLQTTENSEKYKAVLDIMEYVSTKEGQEALASDTGGMFSSLSGTPAPNVVEIADLKSSLEQGRYGVFPQLKNSQNAFREGLAGMIKGTATKQDVINLADAQNATPMIIEAPMVYGKASEDFTMVETGNFVADSMRKMANTEIALFLDNGKDGRYNGKGISGKIYKGDVTNVDINRILPDLKHGEDGTLWKIQMTGENLINTIEHAIPVDNDQKGWFYYFSGLIMQYDVTKEPGERISSIKLTSGEQIEKEKIYSIAVMDETVLQDYIIECEKTSETIASILQNEVQQLQTISPSNDGRFIFS